MVGASAVTRDERARDKCSVMGLPIHFLFEWLGAT
jgi:hypothetical protein